MWLNLRVSSLSMFRLHGDVKLVKSDSERNDNLTKSLERYVLFFKFM
jgi:hypothetical protein